MPDAARAVPVLDGSGDNILDHGDRVVARGNNLQEAIRELGHFALAHGAGEQVMHACISSEQSPPDQSAFE